MIDQRLQGLRSFGQSLSRHSMPVQTMEGGFVN
jgi:hypothetical protein